MGVRRNLDGHASFVDLPMCPIALPTRSVGGIGRVCVSRHLDGHAGTVGLAIAPIALPPAAIAFRARMLRNLDGTTLAEHMAWYSRQKREKNRGAHGHGIGSSHLRLLFSCESGSFLDVIGALQKISSGDQVRGWSVISNHFGASVWIPRGRDALYQWRPTGVCASAYIGRGKRVARREHGAGVRQRSSLAMYAGAQLVGKMRRRM